MPTDTLRARDAGSVASRCGWRLVAGALRPAPPALESATHILLPLTRLQAAAGSALFGPSSLPVEATLACSGADALALCLAAILAYPVQLAHARSPAGRRRRAGTPRPQHAADRHARTRRRVAAVVQRAPRLRLAGGAHARDRRLRLRLDARRGSPATRPPDPDGDP